MVRPVALLWLRPEHVGLVVGLKLSLILFILSLSGRSGGMVDASDSKSDIREGVQVQFLSPAPEKLP
jgi:hypothetical protein